MTTRAASKIITAVAAVTIFASILGWLFWRWSSHRWAERVAQVREGMSEAEVEGVMDKPDEVAQTPFPISLQPPSTACAQAARRVLVFRRGGLPFQRGGIWFHV